MSAISQAELWLYQLGLPALSQQEGLYLASLPDELEECALFDALVQICTKRYEHNNFWPDFAVLGVACPLPAKPFVQHPRVYAIGL